MENEEQKKKNRNELYNRMNVIRHGVIDVIEILDGTITVLTEEELK